MYLKIKRMQNVDTCGGMDLKDMKSEEHASFVPYFSWYGAGRGTAKAEEVSKPGVASLSCHVHQGGTETAAEFS